MKYMLLIFSFLCSIVFVSCYAPPQICGGKEIDMETLTEKCSSSFETEKFSIPKPLKESVKQVERALALYGLECDYDEEAGILTTSMKLLESDEVIGTLQNYTPVYVTQWGSLILLFEETGNNTNIELRGFYSSSNNPADRYRLKIYHPFVQKYTDVIQGKTPCPCKYLTDVTCE